MSNLTVSCKIRELRKKAGYTQAEVSRMLNIQRQTYSNYENASRTPPLEIIIALAEIYHVSVDYLVRGTEAASPTASSVPARQSAARQMMDDFSSLPKAAQKEVCHFVQFKKLYSE